MDGDLQERNPGLGRTRGEAVAQWRSNRAANRAAGVDRFGRPLPRVAGTNPRALGTNPRAQQQTREVGVRVFDDE